MSGGIPKRVKISNIQENTPSKSGRWGKKGIIACSGERSRQALCNYVRTRTHELPPLQTSFSWSAQMTAADLSGGGAFAFDGFNKYPPGGYIPVNGGVLNPPSTSWTEVLSIVSDSSGGPNFTFRAIGVHIPETITISGGDLTQSYTLSIDMADIVNPIPPATPYLWIWFGTGFSFTPGQTYTIFFN